MSALRVPRQPRREVWVVRVDRTYDGPLTQDVDRLRLADELDPDSEEYLEAVGPEEGAIATSVYGPYTERQAKKVAASINEIHRADASLLAHAERLRRYFELSKPDRGIMEVKDR